MSGGHSASRTRPVPLLRPVDHIVFWSFASPVMSPLLPVPRSGSYAAASPPEPAALFHLSRAGWILTAADPTRREREAQPQLEDVDVCSGVERDRWSEQPAPYAEEAVCGGSEPGIVVLEEAREPVQESIFSANASSPTPSPLHHRGGRASPEKNAVISFHESTPTLHVGKKAIPGVADATSNGCE